MTALFVKLEQDGVQVFVIQERVIPFRIRCVRLNLVTLWISHVVCCKEVLPRGAKEVRAGSAL